MTLRNLEPEVVDALRQRARREGRSLNALICEILTREAREVLAPDWIVAELANALRKKVQRDECSGEQARAVL